VINFIEYQNLKKAYSVIRSTIYSGIDFGDSDEDKVIDRITLGDIKDFIEKTESKTCKCDYCNGSGGFPDNEAGFKPCPRCNGDGGYFKETSIDLNLDW
jgi:hypothetical protein